MPYFLCRLNAPRPDFPMEMTDGERALMQAHAAYWFELTSKGSALLFGPVLDPKGMWGLGIIEAADEGATQALTAADPAVKGEAGFSYDIMPVQVAAIRGVKT
jgi:uncharacterized protein YciI